MLTSKLRRFIRGRNKQSNQPAFKLVWYRRLLALARAYTHSISTAITKRVFVGVDGVRNLVMPPTVVSVAHLAHPLYWIAWLGRFLVLWLVTRPKTHFLASIPAIAMIVVGVAISALVYVGSSQHRAIKYRKILERQVQLANYEGAIVATSCLQDLDQGNSKLLFTKATILVKANRPEEAEKLMLRLAFEQKSTDAAIWLLESHFELEFADSWPKSKSTQFLELCVVAGQSQRAKKLTHYLLGRYYYRKGELSQSLKFFESLTVTNPEYSLAVAQINHELGLQEEARKSARASRRYLVERLKENPSSTTTRKQLASSLLLLDDELEAAQVLMDGLNYTQGDANRELRFSASDALVARLKRLERSPNRNSFLEQVQVVSDALRIAPDNRTVSTWATEFVRRIATNASEERIELNKLLASGVNLNAAHLVSGLVCATTHEYNSANLHFDFLKSSQDQLYIILCNISLLLAESSDDLVASALMLSDYAENLSSNNAMSIGCRGVALFRAGKTDGAIKDLEFALSTVELPIFHSSIALAYESKGLNELAGHHRSQAARLLQDIEQEKKLLQWVSPSQ